MHLLGEKIYLQSPTVGPWVCCLKKWQEVGLILRISFSLTKLLLNKALVPQETMSPHRKKKHYCMLCGFIVLSEDGGKKARRANSLTVGWKK